MELSDTVPELTDQELANVRYVQVLQDPAIDKGPTCRRARLQAMRRAAAGLPRVGELTDEELLRLYSRLTRNPFLRKAMSLSEIVAKSAYRSRSRR